jgi:hypothetical protein
MTRENRHHHISDTSVYLVGMYTGTMARNHLLGTKGGNDGTAKL